MEIKLQMFYNYRNRLHVYWDNNGEYKELVKITQYTVKKAGQRLGIALRTKNVLVENEEKIV